MVGIGGGVPSAEADIRLGDVVVSQPYQTFGGVVQYDMGKTTTSGFERTGSLNSPPQILLSAINTVRANNILGKSTLPDYVSKLECIPSFQRRMAGPDVLFEAAYDHEGGNTCEQCGASRQQARPQRESKEEVAVHYGTIASGNQVMKSAIERDKISAKLGSVLCFEMEAAGLMNSFPCLVIRGICDYADSHKNKRWQTYAAGTAAGYAKEVLSVIPAKEVMETHPAEEAMRRAGKRSLPSRSLESAPIKRRIIEISSSPENDIAEQEIVPLAIPHQNVSRTSINEEQKQVLLESLRFDQIDARQTDIRSAHAKTCRWLLRHPEYLDWFDVTKLGNHHGFLWIKGKPGTGKSTLMKFALINARKTMKDRIVLSFFFNARGEEVERSTLGTYRSLLLQLLEQLTELQSVFGSLSPSATSFSADQQWNIETLKSLLEQAIKKLKDSSVVCFIDALDECEEEQVRDMIQFFEHIGELAVSDGICFLVCFSSRHYPHITIRKGLELVLEGQEGHIQDITNYIERELKIGKSRTAQQVRAELQEKASGIFMWVVLVVGILNKQWDRAQVHALRRKLREIPSNLHELFRDILLRDSHNKDSLVLCIQWVLFAKQPLTPEQLYHAILSGIELNAVSEWDTEENSKDVIRRFILDSSKGLAEATVSKVPKVQFIHESVRDFLLKENGLGEIWPELGSNFQGQSHERLKQCCHDSMNVDDAATLRTSDDLSRASSPTTTGVTQSAIGKFPFLEYAVHNVLYHANAAEGGGISQVSFLDRFSRPQWATLGNLFEKRKVRRHTERVSLLYILAELNMANLIKAQSSGGRCLEVEKERYGCPLLAAIATRSKEAAQACIEGLKTNHSTGSDDKGRYEEYYEEELARGSVGRGLIYSERRGILSYVVEFGREPIVKLLLKKGADVNAQGGSYGNALQAASYRGNEPIVKLLLEKGANVNAHGGMYSNALYAASSEGHEPVVELLLKEGAEVNAQGGNYGSALRAASSEGHESVVKLLLEKGADVNAQGGFYGNALRAASSEGHEPVVKLLLEKGAL